MAKSKIYVVYVGRQPGLYETWDECRAEVEGYPGARYKSFYSCLLYTSDAADE